MSHLRTVQEIYSAFGRGDVSAILDSLADDVEWEYGASPSNVLWLQPRRGRSGAEAFFASLQGMRINAFTVKALFESAGVVVALVDVDFTVRSTGRRVTEEDEVHIWRFDAGGKVSRFRHRVDTLAHERACER
jgi:ketosteroid isomerase-like protein